MLSTLTRAWECLIQSFEGIKASYSFSDFLWIAWVIAIVSWFATYTTNRSMQRRLETHRLIDKFNEQVEKIEDLSLDYLIRQKCDVDHIHINIALKRLSGLAVAIQKMHKQRSVPHETIVLFRQAITGHDELPITAEKARAILIRGNDLKSTYEKSF